MELKVPAVFLSFDDLHLEEWHSMLPMLEAYGARVTFYLSDLDKIDPCGWQQLHDMRVAGHTIAFHGLHHLRARPTVRDEGCEAYLNRDIFEGLSILANHGFDNVRHFSYPYGNRNDESDVCLFAHFDTLRTGGRMLHTPESIRSTRLLNALNYGKFREREFCGHEPLLHATARNKKIVCFYMHKPIEHRLKYMFEYGMKHGVGFYPMGVLNRE